MEPIIIPHKPMKPPWEFENSNPMNSQLDIYKISIVEIFAIRT